jgi:hypothetical protein
VGALALLARLVYRVVCLYERDYVMNILANYIFGNYLARDLMV